MASEIHLMFPVELLAVFVGGLSGALAAVRKQFDLFGVLVLAWAAGLGGGLLRDVLIGATPPVGISDWRLVVGALAAGVVAFFFHPRLQRIRRFIAVLDAGALALFTLVGTLKGLEWEVTGVAAVFVGVLTAIGGGVLRDVLTGEVPAVLHQRQLYAVPTLVGAVAVVVLWDLGALDAVTSAVVVVGVFGLRLLAMRYKLSAPGPWRGGLAG